MKEFFVYVLIDPRNDLPFYVGKGGGDPYRHKWHELEAVNRGKQPTKHFYNKIRKLHRLGLEIPKERTRLDKILRGRIIDLDYFSRRTEKVLENAGIDTVGQLVMKTEADLLKYRNFGKRSLNEIKDKLQRHGIGLGMTIGRQKESTKAA